MKIEDLKPNMVLDILVPYVDLNAWANWIFDGKNAPSEILCLSDHDNINKVVVAKLEPSKTTCNMIYVMSYVEDCDKLHCLYLREDEWRLNSIETLKRMRKKNDLY